VTRFENTQTVSRVHSHEQRAVPPDAETISRCSIKYKYYSLTRIFMQHHKM
jgi:hypothetical protein